MQVITQCLPYCAAHLEATVKFCASDIILHVKSIALYLTAPKAMSHAVGYHYLSNHSTPNKNIKSNDPLLLSNGAIDILCTIMHKVVVSATEAELPQFST